MGETIRGQRAGTYAQSRYLSGLRRWRSRTRWILAGGLGPFILAGTVVLALDGHLLSWVAGAVAGVCAGVWMVLREAPPPYVENWQRGAEGERKTAGVLAPLERSGLTVVHDVDSPYGNYDHIAVGRSGVFLLETKNPRGIVELRRGVPHLRRELDPDADTPLARVRPRALSAAARLKSDLEQQTGVRTWVQAVIVLWADFPEGLVDDGRCVFVHGSRLASWIGGRPAGLNRANAETIALAIRGMGSHEATD